MILQDQRLLSDIVALVGKGPPFFSLLVGRPQTTFPHKHE